MNKSKTDVEFGQSKRLKLLRNSPITGTNGYGAYWLYPVVTEQGIEESFFAPEPIHNIIQESKLKAGDEFILSRVQNGKPGSSKLELSLVSVSQTKYSASESDSLKELMIQSMKDAAEIVVAVPELAYRAEDARAIGLSIFIARSHLKY